MFPGSIFFYFALFVSFYQSKSVASLLLAFLLLTPILIYVFFKFTFFVDPISIGASIPKDILYANGNTTLLTDQFKGRRIAVLIVSPGCRFCIHTLDNFSKLKTIFAIPIIVVSTRTVNTANGFNNFGNLDIIIDHDNKITAAFHVITVPSVFFVDENSILLYRRSGWRDFSSDSVDVNNYFIQSQNLK